MLSSEFLRYLINGLVATAIHFGVLTFSFQVAEFKSAGISSIIASIVAILVSFLGNKYFVFRHKSDNLLREAAKFSILYIAIALLHGITLYIWTDIYEQSYIIGFIFAVIMQVMLAFWGSKFLVFRK